MRIIRLLCILVACMASIAVVKWGMHEMRLDRCLDNGGRWNAGSATCEDFATSDTGELT